MPMEVGEALSDSKNGNTAYSQHQTTSQGTTGSIQTSNGGKAIGASGQYNSAAVAETANGNKCCRAAKGPGNAYKNTGSGWQNTNGSSNSAASKGYGGQEKSSD